MRTRPNPGRPISEEGHVAVSEESKSSMSPERAEDAEEAADVVEDVVAHGFAEAQQRLHSA